MGIEYSSGIMVYSYRNGERVFLFLKRDADRIAKRGWLDIPKGHIEKGEGAREAAIRETFEESGLRLDPEKFFRREFSYHFNIDGETVKKMLTVFIARADGNAKVRVSSEHAGHAWLGLDEAMKELTFENSKHMLKVANDYVDRMEKMRELNSEYGKLPEKIKDWGLSKRLVPGEGPLDAKVMFIGQAPGRQEDEQLRPFIGMSGKLLDKMIESAGLKRSQVYITSVAQFFPPKNRAPSSEEIAVCRSFLKRQIEIIDPKIVVLLGAVSAGEILGDKKVMKSHGTFVKKDRYYFITIHPAAAVRLKKNVPLMEADFAKLKEELKKLNAI